MDLYSTFYTVFYLLDVFACGKQSHNFGQFKPSHAFLFDGVRNILYLPRQLLKLHVIKRSTVYGFR